MVVSKNQFEFHFLIAEDYNDKKFQSHYLKLRDTLEELEIGVEGQLPFSFANCLQSLYETTLNLRFTRNGIRIQNIPNIRAKRAKSNDMTFRIHKNRNAHSQSQQILSLAKPKNDFEQQYRELEAKKQQEVDLLNPNVAREIGKNAPLAPGPIYIKNFSIPEPTPLNRKTKSPVGDSVRSRRHKHTHTHLIKRNNICCECHVCSCNCHDTNKVNPNNVTSETRITSNDHQSVKIDLLQDQLSTD